MARGVSCGREVTSPGHRATDLQDSVWAAMFVVMQIVPLLQVISRATSYESGKSPSAREKEETRRGCVNDLVDYFCHCNLLLCNESTNNRKRCTVAIAPTQREECRKGLSPSIVSSMLQLPYGAQLQSSNDYFTIK